MYYPPLYTALRFATDNFTVDGYVIYAYVFTLGRKAIELQAFAEEVRDLNTYTDFYLFHDEGEVVAKIEVPATQIERVEKYTIEGIKSLRDGRLPTPDEVFPNDVYRDPKQYANIRGLLEVEE